MSRIEQNVLPNDVIMGGQTYWLNLYKHKYYSWEQLIYYLRLYSGAPIAEAFFYFRPTIFILDSHIDSFLQSSTRDNTAVSPYISLPREQLLEFIARHGALLDEFDSGVYGRIRLYRLNYDQ